MTKTAGFLLVCLFGAATRSWAQAIPEDPGTTATFRVGSLALTPTFNVSQIGVDSNVMFEEFNPKRDFTFIATPGAKSFIRLGTARVAAHTTADWVYFARTSQQRSLNFGQTFVADLPLATFTPRIAGEYLTTRQRPNSEIDARVRRRTSGWVAGSLIRFNALTAVDLEMGRQHSTFDDVEVDGVLIGQALNRAVTHVAASFRTDVTPLTTLVVKAVRERSAFVISTGRDAAAWSASGGFEFQPIALLTGSALVGYQEFTPVDPSVEPFTGVVAAVDLRYLLRESTSVGVKVDRQVEFSYWPNESYYISTALEAVTRQALSANWDFVVRAARETLVYPRIDAADVDNRHDRRILYGAGIGYWFTFNGRIGLDLVHGARQSEIPGRSYESFRVGGSFSYGF